ncbi:hypothetical protein IFM89_007323 [Coptis chinensis]|uniref:Ubiquitin-like domain-containing protein n=1 Tax=Coptis chinensis TaxID=261450 RepID=A0A835LD49_9MAGN|nr:hypothetical protein IFM89_007323 [Coptis chinensis]
MLYPMKLVVEILTGTLFHIQVDDEATIGDLKREIGAHEKVSLDRFFLVHDDNQDCLMHENGALVEYGIEDGSHVHLCFIPLDDESPHQIFFTLPDSLFLGTDTMSTFVYTTRAKVAGYGECSEDHSSIRTLLVVQSDDP